MNMRWINASEKIPYDPNEPHKGYYTKYGDGETDVLTKNQILDVIENGYLNVIWLDESESSFPSHNDGWKKLFDLLAEHGGEIVSTNDLSSDWIEQARASGRMWVDENSLGYVWEPNIKQFPTNDKEVEEFDRWYPLPVKLPKELEDPEIFFANMRKRELEEKQKKQN